MNKRKLYALAFAASLYFTQDKPNKETELVMTSINKNAKEVEEQVKHIVIDNKVANYKYSKEQIKYRKRFYK